VTPHAVRAALSAGGIDLPGAAVYGLNDSPGLVWVELHAFTGRARRRAYVAVDNALEPKLEEEHWRTCSGGRTWRTFSVCVVDPDHDWRGDKPSLWEQWATLPGVVPRRRRRTLRLGVGIELSIGPSDDG
jgi:hypothetical protein